MSTITEKSKKKKREFCSGPVIKQENFFNIYFKKFYMLMKETSKSI